MTAFPTTIVRRERWHQAALWLLLPLLALAPCCNPKPKDNPPPDEARLTVANQATQSTYTIVVDGSAAGSVGPGRTEDVILAAGSHTIELRFAGSTLPACAPMTQTLAAGSTSRLECSADCNAGNFGGVRLRNGSSKTTYVVRYAGTQIATVAPGQQTDVLRVPAGFDLLQFIAGGTSTVICSATVSTTRCEVRDWSCDRDLCEAAQTGDVTFTNQYAFATVLEAAGGQVVLQAGQTSAPLTFPAGTVTIVLRRQSNGNVLCDGPVDVVLCETRNYTCNP